MVKSRFSWVFSLMFIALTLSAEAAIVVSPGEIHFSSPPGQEAVAEVTIANGADTHRDVYLDLIDWDMDVGQRIPRPAGEGARSLTPFLIRRPPSFVRLAPAESVTLTVTVRRPADDRGTRWSGLALLAQPKTPNSRLQEEGPLVLRRQVVRLYHTSTPPSPTRGTIDSIRRRWPADPLQWQVQYVNESDRVYKVRGEWRLTDEEGRLFAQGSLAPFLSYPGVRHASFGPLPTLPPGSYHLLVLLASEDGDTTAGQLVLRVGDERESLQP